MLSEPFWIQTPTHPCTLHPLHSLEHIVYFHDLQFSLMTSLVSLQYLQNFWWIGFAGSAGGWPRTWEGICKCWGHSDPDCHFTVSVMFWFACFFRGIFHAGDLHKEEETMVFEAHGMSFPCTKLLLFNYAKVNTFFHSVALLSKGTKRPVRKSPRMFSKCSDWNNSVLPVSSIKVISGDKAVVGHVGATMMMFLFVRWCWRTYLWVELIDILQW